MAACGSLYLFTERLIPHPVDVIRQVSDLCVAQTARLYRSDGQERGWEAHLETMERIEGLVLHSSADYVQTFGLLDENASIEDVAEAYQEDSSLHAIYSSESSLAGAIFKWYEHDADREIVGDFTPCEPALKIGWHDLICYCEEAEEQILVARPFLSVGFFGWGYVANYDHDVLIPHLLTNPALVEFRTRLEERVGSLTPALDLSY